MHGTDTLADWLSSGVPYISGRPNGPLRIPAGQAASHARNWSSFLMSGMSATVAPIDGAALLGERAAFTGWGRKGRTSVGGRCRLLPTVSGWAAVSCARPDDLYLLGALIGETIVGDPWMPLAHWLSDRDAEEIDERIELLGLAGGCLKPAETSALPVPQRARSMTGARVVDFSSLWAGPLCAQLLGAAGAEVVKVETPQRPDGARRGNRSFYDLLHEGHYSVTLDPSCSDERDALKKLVASADVVIEASRPRALANFGLNCETYAAAGCTWISITAHGRYTNRVGFGDDVAASSGLIVRDDDGSPMFAGDAIADPLCGLYSAVCAMDANNNQGGRVWDIAMSKVVSSTLNCDAAPSAQPFNANMPRHRAVEGRAADSGAHTEEILRGLGIRL